MPGEILLVSCYELGRQPVALASAAGFLASAGFRPATLDLAVDNLDRPGNAGRIARARLIAVSVPMHTALHLGVRASQRLRQLAPRAHLCFFGLYALLNQQHLLREGIADSLLGGEVEAALVELAGALAQGRPLDSVEGLGHAGRPPSPLLRRLRFPRPERSSLPPASGYAQLEWGDARHTAAAIEASRGCLHHCRHCPIPPLYGGRFFVVPRDVVLADVEQLVEQGVRHLTFADPDFFNGPGHGMRLAAEIHRRHPDLTFDITTKVELILRHRHRLAELAELGCVFIVSAVESLSNTVLGHLRKGHTRADVFRALDAVREAGIALRPSLVAFTPWTGIADYLDVLEWVEREELIDHVDPVQYSIRLLIPPGSPLVALEALRPHLDGLDPSSFSYRWTHPDPRMDSLQSTVARRVDEAARSGEVAERTFDWIRETACSVGDRPAPRPTRRGSPARERVRPPRLTEPWFC